MTVAREPVGAADGWLLCTTLAAVPESVRRARGLVGEIAASLGASPATSADIALAVSEAAANAVLHAYAPGAGGAFDLCVRRDGRGHLEVTVRDYGHGFGRARAPGMGVGLKLIRRLARECRIDPADPGVTVRLAFAVGAV